MTHIVSCFIILVLAKVTISAEDDFDCGRKNAIKTEYATKCDLDKCPVAEHYSRVCSKDPDLQKPGCICRFNEKFAKNGTCIPTQQCPPFDCDKRPNEEYVACPSYCTDDCSQRTCQTFGLILMVVECFPECRCKQGFNRKKGICVPYEEC